MNLDTILDQSKFKNPHKLRLGLGLQKSDDFQGIRRETVKIRRWSSINDIFLWLETESGSEGIAMERWLEASSTVIVGGTSTVS